MKKLEFLFNNCMALSSNSGKYNPDIIGNSQMSAIDDLPIETQKI